MSIKPKMNFVNIIVGYLMCRYSRRMNEKSKLRTIKQSLDFTLRRIVLICYIQDKYNCEITRSQNFAICIRILILLF